MTIEINNLTSFSVGKKFFTGLAKKIIKGENKGIKNLSIAFVLPEEIKKLNLKYRKKNKSTDVLAFSDNRSYKLEAISCSEIVICPELVKENAKKYRNSFKQEMTRVFIHGLLHILGYDHEKSKMEAEKMEEKEKKYLE